MLDKRRFLAVVQATRKPEPRHLRHRELGDLLGFALGLDNDRLGDHGLGDHRCRRGCRVCDRRCHRSRR